MIDKRKTGSRKSDRWVDRRRRTARTATLLQLLAAFPHIEIAGEAESGREALELVELLGLLLDIEIPDVDGSAVLEALPQPTAPAIIFGAGIQDQAVKAFELRATDFVVKPVNGDRLATALHLVAPQAGTAKLTNLC